MVLLFQLILCNKLTIESQIVPFLFIYLSHNRVQIIRWRKLCKITSVSVFNTYSESYHKPSQESPAYKSVWRQAESVFCRINVFRFSAPNYTNKQTHLWTCSLKNYILVNPGSRFGGNTCILLMTEKGAIPLLEHILTLFNKPPRSYNEIS